MNIKLALGLLRRVCIYPTFLRSCYVKRFAAQLLYLQYTLVRTYEHVLTHTNTHATAYAIAVWCHLTECRLNTSQPSGALRTPYYSQQGSGILTCDYVISNTNPTTRKLVTSFEHENFDKGYLLVYGGSMSSGTLLANITGKSLGTGQCVCTRGGRSILHVHVYKWSWSTRCVEICSSVFMWCYCFDTFSREEHSSTWRHDEWE